MKALLALVVTSLALGDLAKAEVVEEETWYNADGKVVKTVKRTLSGKDARREPDWEPAWVRRERARDAARTVRYSPSRSPYRGYGYGTSFPYFHPRCYYAPRRYGAGGFSGFLWSGRGGTRWGVGYRGSGLNLFLTR